MIKQKISKYTSYNFDPNSGISSYIRDVDTDLRNLFLMMSGRIRFGDGTDGELGENMSGEFQRFTSDSSANTEFSVTHRLGAVPIGYIVLGQDKAGSLYQLSGTGTTWTSSTIYLKCDVASVEFLVFLIK